MAGKFCNGAHKVVRLNWIKQAPQILDFVQQNLDEELTVKANVMVCKDDGPVAFRCSSQSNMENAMEGFDVMLLEANRRKDRCQQVEKVHYSNL